MVDVVNGGGVDIAVTNFQRGVDGGSVAAVLCESAAVVPVLVTEFRERFAAVVRNGQVIRRGHEIIRHHDNVAADGDGIVAVDRSNLFAVDAIEVGDERAHGRAADVVAHQKAVVLRRKARVDGRIVEIVDRQGIDRFDHARTIAAKLAARGVPQKAAEVHVTAGGLDEDVAVEHGIFYDGVRAFGVLVRSGFFKPREHRVEDRLVFTKVAARLVASR